MHLFCNGGGAGAQTAEALAAFNGLIDHAKPILYIPLAMEPDRYPGCLAWAREGLSRVQAAGIEMARSGEELASMEFGRYAALFIGGGNTFRLLRTLKESGAFEKIQEYLDRGGVVFGGSAGAIIFGADIRSCAADDRNETGFADTGGFDRIGGLDLFCHYGNRSPEKDRASREYLLAYSKGKRVLALPEEDTLWLHDGKAELIGGTPCSLFTDGRETIFHPTAGPCGQFPAEEM